MKKISFAFIGVNQEIYNVLSQREDVDVTGFLKLSENDQWDGVFEYTSFQDMLRKSDAIVVCNSSYVTSDRLARIASDEKHIFMDSKPGFPREHYSPFIHLMDLYGLKVACMGFNEKNLSDLVSEFIKAINEDKPLMKVSDVFGT